MKIPPDTRWLNDPDAKAVCRALGGSVYFVGGCVRNALMGLPDSDVDLATPIPPKEVMALAEAAKLKAVPTGFDHGTVTVVSGGKGFEVTTFRRDVETDGRRAVVVYSDRIEDDARRRDFTMNALYATAEGDLVDPLSGLGDLMARRVRFIEDASARIREDFLRILRYFRFHAWYGSDEDGFDDEALNAIASNLAGLETLSAERVGAEMAKLLSAPDPVFAVAGMRQTGVLGILLPGSDDRMLGPLVHAEMSLDCAPDWRRRLAVLGGEGIGEKIRLSKADRKALEQISITGFGAMALTEVAYRHGFEIARDALLIRSVVSETPTDASILPSLETAARQKFPVRASDLMNDYAGPALGRKLAELERRWIDSDFTNDRDALLKSD